MARGADGDSQATMRLDVREPEAAPAAKKYSSSGALKFEGTQYQSSIPGNSKLDHSLSASVNLKVGMESGSSTSLFDFTGEKFIDWGSSQFSVRELYWSHVGNEGRTETSLGRKLQYWSQGDQDWQLDLWQPRQTFDGLRPEQQGLTGGFFKHREGSIETLVLLSPIFIPTMGPDIRNDNGSLESDSRWYRAPSSTFIFQNKQRRIVYSLNIPHLEELVTKPGAALRLKVEPDSRVGTWASVGFAYKPINRLLVKYDQKLESVEEGEDTGSAPLFPVVGYHSLFSADLGYRFERSMVAVSFLADEPQSVDQDTDDPYIVQHPEPAKVYTLHADTEMDVPGFTYPLVWTAGYMRIDGGGIADYDAKGRYKGAVFTQRFQFTHAALAQVEMQTDIRDRKLLSRLRYMREFDQRGMIASAEATYYPRKTIGFTLGADVLGVDDTSADNADKGFLNEFRANDRVYAGLSYVF